MCSDAHLFAGPRDAGQAVAVPQGELDLDVDALRSFSADVSRPQPVVLVGLHDVTHLVGPHRGVPLIHDADLLPLRARERTFRVKGTKDVAEYPKVERWRTRESSVDGGRNFNFARLFLAESPSVLTFRASWPSRATR